MIRRDYFNIPILIGVTKRPIASSYSWLLCFFIWGLASLGCQRSLVVESDILLPPDVFQGEGIKHGELLTIPVEVHGHNLLMALDTAASRSSLDTKWKQLLGEKISDGNAWGVGGEATTEIYVHPPIFAGGVELKTGKWIDTYDYELLRRVSGQKIDGILGADCLQHYCLQVDFEHTTIRFLDCRELPSNQLGDSFPLGLNQLNLFAIEGALLGGESISVIDTGMNSIGVLSTHEFDQIVALEDLRVSEKKSIGLGGIASSRITRLPNATLGDTIYGNLPVSEFHFPVIGLGFLALHRSVTLDLTGGAAYFNPYEGEGRFYPEINMSGLRLALNEQSDVQIVSVDQISPGEEAGIKPGDVIVKINGRLARKTKLWEIRKQLKSRHGDHVSLEIMRGKDNLYFELALRRKI